MQDELDSLFRVICVASSRIFVQNQSENKFSITLKGVGRHQKQVSIWSWDNNPVPMLKKIRIEFNKTKTSNFLFAHNITSDIFSRITKFTGSHVTYLDVSCGCIRDIPDSITRLIHLETLIASRNYIKAVSPRIKRLRKLNKLDLSQNKISHFHVGFSSMPSLENLDLRNNRLKNKLEITSAVDMANSLFPHKVLILNEGMCWSLQE